LITIELQITNNHYDFFYRRAKLNKNTNISEGVKFRNVACFANYCLTMEISGKYE